jgi:methionyl aminopeptidase
MEDQSRFQSRPPIHNAEQMQGIRAACRLGREVLDFAHTLVRPGVTTEEIDREVHRFTVMRGAYPSPLNYRGFPKACCTSVNEVICHGIPDCRPLQEGDIVNVDISVYFNGYHADLNETFCVGRVEDKYKQLIKVTQSGRRARSGARSRASLRSQVTHDAMMKAIAVCRPNALIRDVGRAISDHVRPFKFGVVRTYCGHGIGELFHCAPNVPHYNNARVSRLIACTRASVSSARLTRCAEHGDHGSRHGVHDRAHGEHGALRGRDVARRLDLGDR